MKADFVLFSAGLIGMAGLALGQMSKWCFRTQARWLHSEFSEHLATH